MAHPLSKTLTTLFPITLFACSSSPPPPPQSVYTAEQLNAVALAGLEDDSLGAPQRPTEPTPPPEEAPPPPQPSTVRLIHAVVATPSVSLSLGDATEARVPSLAFRAATTLELPEGDQTLTARRVTPTTPPNNTPLFSFSLSSLASGSHYTTVLHPASAAPRAAVTATTAQNETLSPDPGSARLRFFHAIVGLGPVDVCTAPVAARPAMAGHPATAAQPATQWVTNLTFGHFSSIIVGESTTAYASLTPGSAITVQLRAHTPRPCTGPVRGTARVDLADQSVSTVTLTGRIAPRVAPSLLFCPEAPTTGDCTTVSMR